MNGQAVPSHNVSGDHDQTTVYYIVGRPRSGSTFVGNWIAQQLDILNAGEVWQTFRAMDRVEATGELGRWGEPENKRAKAAEISGNAFWSDVLARPEQDPYAALLAVAGPRWGALVDCSKTDRGIERYRALGCRVVVVHTVRAFTSWQASLTGYRRKYDLSVPSRGRLLLNYLRLNRQYREWRNSLPYRVVPQERLPRIAEFLDLDALGAETGPGYSNAEMFGTPGFSGQFDPARATQRITAFDRLVYAMIHVRPGPAAASGVRS
ncbi:hypothetical protein [Mameliella sediminis]|uniref:hypothetical protein n=1 Tax=Mameliella sediminis TaxID=2836866 RepID=UPI001C4588A3|nr:hypothetical protein [Mameliella sediminis]MBV7395634.1 hypothetical protein [Mameliella sediminis]